MGLPDWAQLTGLLHDVGKVIYKRGCDEDGTSSAKQVRSAIRRTPRTLT